MSSRNKRRPQPAKQGATNKRVGAEGSAPTPILDRRLLHTKGAADYLGISPRTLWTLTNLDKLPSVRFGTGGRKSVRYDIGDLDDWVEQQKRGGQA